MTSRSTSAVRRSRPRSTCRARRRAPSAADTDEHGHADDGRRAVTDAGADADHGRRSGGHGTAGQPDHPVAAPTTAAASTDDAASSGMSRGARILIVLLALVAAAAFGTFFVLSQRAKSARQAPPRACRGPRRRRGGRGRRAQRAASPSSTLGPTARRATGRAGGAPVDRRSRRGAEADGDGPAAAAIAADERRPRRSPARAGAVGAAPSRDRHRSTSRAGRAEAEPEPEPSRTPVADVGGVDAHVEDRSRPSSPQPATAAATGRRRDGAMSTAAAVDRGRPVQPVVADAEPSAELAPSSAEAAEPEVVDPPSRRSRRRRPDEPRGAGRGRCRRRPNRRRRASRSVVEPEASSPRAGTGRDRRSRRVDADADAGRRRAADRSRMARPGRCRRRRLVAPKKARRQLAARRRPIVVEPHDAVDTATVAEPAEPEPVAEAEPVAVVDRDRSPSPSPGAVPPSRAGRRARAELEPVDEAGPAIIEPPAEWPSIAGAAHGGGRRPTAWPLAERPPARVSSRRAVEPPVAGAARARRRARGRAPRRGRRAATRRTVRPRSGPGAVRRPICPSGRGRVAGSTTSR